MTIIFSLFCIFILNLIFLVVLLLSNVNAQSFTYTNSNPDYIVGQAIETNTPNLESRVGTWSVNPSFSRGLVLNNDGTITGTPTEEYQNTYVVSFTAEGSTDILTCSLFIRIWKQPTSLSYGITNLTSSVIIYHSFVPTIDHRVASYIIYIISYSVSCSPTTELITIDSTTGVLTFNGYEPLENQVTITVTAVNIAGSTSITIYLYKGTDVTFYNGIRVSLDDMTQFGCDYVGTGYIYNTYAGSWENLEGLDTVDAYDVWDEKMNSSMTGHYIDWFNASFTGYIHLNADEDYTFYHRIDRSVQDKIFVNNELIFSTHESCNSWNTINNKTVHLRAGYNLVHIIAEVARKPISDVQKCRFVLHYSSPSNPTESPIPFLYSINFIFI